MDFKLMLYEPNIVDYLYNNTIEQSTSNYCFASCYYKLCSFSETDIKKYTKNPCSYIKLLPSIKQNCTYSFNGNVQI